MSNKWEFLKLFLLKHQIVTMVISKMVLLSISGSYKTMWSNWSLAYLFSILSSHKIRVQRKIHYCSASRSGRIGEMSKQCGPEKQNLHRPPTNFSPAFNRLTKLLTGFSSRFWDSNPPPPIFLSDRARLLQPRPALAADSFPATAEAEVLLRSGRSTTLKSRKNGDPSQEVQKNVFTPKKSKNRNLLENGNWRNNRFSFDL